MKNILSVNRFIHRSFRVGGSFRIGGSFARQVRPVGLFIFFCLSIKCDVCTAQAGEWAWMKGTMALTTSAVYGTLGIADTNNTPPGLIEPAEWKDSQGRFWLFGGQSTMENNTLWMYDKQTNSWTWEGGSNGGPQPGIYGTKGVPATTNCPGSRAWGPTSWVDHDGNLWLFGGDGRDGNGDFGALNDLWRYNVSTQEWTWVSGSNVYGESGIYGTQGVPDSNNRPGCRWDCKASWVDDSNALWFFGGWYGGNWNDLWRFDISTSEWTWMKGADYTGQTGVYGSLGVASNTNVPGARQGGCKWRDTQNNFWMFGGLHSVSLYLNDLWKYDPSINEWTWMSGTDLYNDPGTYSSICDSTTTNFPEARSWGACWTDQDGKFWLFGGTHYVKYTSNDLWYYKPSTNEWTWANGSSQYSTPAYGTKGIASTTNHPWSSYGSVAWTDDSCNLWLFGGSQWDGWELNTLWKYIPGCGACMPQGFVNLSASDTDLCENYCINFTDQSTNNPTSWQWIFDGASPDSSSLQNPTTICYNIPGTYDVILITTNAYGIDTLILSAYLTVNVLPAPPVIFQSSDTLVSSVASGYQWFMNGNLIPGATSQTLLITQTGSYTVEVTDSSSCPVSSTITVTNIPSPGFSVTDTTPCEKFCLSFTDESTNNPSTWQWLFPGGDPSSSALQNPNNICYNTPGTYDVTLITPDANGMDTLILHNYITVYPTPPLPTITQIGFTLTSSPASFYQWQLNSLDIPGATNQSYDVLQSGLYTVLVKDSNGCLNSISQYVLISGLDEVSDEAISIYPNPSSGSFTLEWLNHQPAGEVSIDVVNTLGQIIFSSEEPRSIRTADWEEQIDLTGVAHGVYFIEIKTANELVREKILIAK